MPRALLSTGVRWGYSRPSTTMWPPGSGGCTPEMILIIVDLPDPLPPTRQWISPLARSKSTFDSAAIPPKRFEIPRSSRNIIARLPPRDRAGRGPPATRSVIPLGCAAPLPSCTGTSARLRRRVLAGRPWIVSAAAKKERRAWGAPPLYLWMGDRSLRPIPLDVWLRDVLGALDDQH